MRALALVAEQQHALEPDGLVRAQRDAHAQVVRAHHLYEARVLRVAEPQPAQLGRHLQPERAQLPQPRQRALLDLRVRVVLGRVVHLHASTRTLLLLIYIPVLKL